MPEKWLFFVAGEKSGDSHGGLLIEALKRQAEGFSFQGIGGEKMAAAGLKQLYPFEQFQVMGFTDVLRAYPRLRRLFFGTLNHILESKPLAVILIDYPGFNLRLASHLRKNGYQGKIVHYISPTVWAWGKNRINQMEQNLDLLLTIFPFEKSYYKESRLKVEYAGNPLIEAIAGHRYSSDWKELSGIPSDVPLLALFPGSRKREISQNLPLHLEIARLIKKEIPSLHVALSLPDNHPLPNEEWISKLPSRYNYDCMKTCQFALAKSGTITLELALHGAPAAVTYPLTLGNYLLGKYLFRIRLPHYCISNILLKETLYPEWIDRRLDPKTITHSLLNLPSKDYFMKAKETLETILGPQSASTTAAKTILELL